MAKSSAVPKGTKKKATSKKTTSKVVSRKKPLKKKVIKKAKKHRRASKKKMQQLVIENYDYGHRLAWSFLSSWNIRLNQDEVSSIVGAALVEAGVRFEPARKVDFKTFIYYHLRGLLLKEITKNINNQKVINLNQVGSLAINGAEDDTSIVADLINQESPEKEVIKKEKSQSCWEACSKLDELEQEVIVRFFVLDHSLNKISLDLDYCRCHISRVKGQALKKLKELVSGDEILDTFSDAKSIAPGKILPLVKYKGGRGRRKIESESKNSPILEKILASS